ncbi:(2Fe-2S) ferredoxin domain-containing protein [Anaerococcus hydrogenalis]|uniref:NADH-quinone oxidoreductase subunit E n=1 Tax=Anaerococcus hydrogenalis TaxID=33029 RepID=A0A2N6UK96_9FIRM|nr:(2Fe-2S) ferredoxin domain-containing protein [Anaerococcus hydrogenalis]MBS5988657.1 (2Fe-2S) ferredoxin domain-containing protein [Anaerococcus hydrogenalis]MDK7694173.1 (2Fe-2S) ferredoxin domain-containing protein [Anaerococcus hydrogenalis]MDK7695951.1 (2Fe-2S) ferredoxin domain-containing protein [Anaerococcus hydrogenalis]MDK7707200.1 (2Fe-2S) ferredoxin domain-containing protein [Anaerococcus hydrogenalis]PMC82227.1 NADH-quinone oxidoreductase subunit E [Anaerococcus hydrogenalis]
MKIEVCAGARCTMLGSDIIFNRLSDFVEEFNDRLYKGELDVQDIELEIEMITCNDECKKNKKNAPIVIVNGKVFTNAKTEVIMEYILDKAFEDNFK